MNPLDTAVFILIGSAVTSVVVTFGTVQLLMLVWVRGCNMGVSNGIYRALRALDAEGALTPAARGAIARELEHLEGKRP